MSRGGAGERVGGGRLGGGVIVDGGAVAVVAESVEYVGDKACHGKVNGDICEWVACLVPSGGSEQRTSVGDVLRGLEAGPSVGVGVGSKGEHAFLQRGEVAT